MIVGDDDGVMVIPHEIADEIANECAEMTLFENFVIEQVNKGASIIGLYPPTDESTLTTFNKWKSFN